MIPLEQYIWNSLAENFGLDSPIVGIIGFMVLAVLMFLMRPPTSVAIASVGMLAIMVFGTVVNQTFGLNMSPYVFGMIILLFGIVIYAGFKHWIAKEW